MIPDSLRKVILIGLLVAMTLATDACAAASRIFSKASPTSDDSWSDSAGGFSQH